MMHSLSLLMGDATYCTLIPSHSPSRFGGDCFSEMKLYIYGESELEFIVGFMVIKYCDRTYNLSDGE